MVWPMVIAGVATAVSSYSTSKSASKQNKIQKAQNEFNAMMQNTTNLQNVMKNMMLTKFNNDQLIRDTMIKVGVNHQNAEYNMEVIRATADYNDSLMAEDLSIMWDSMELDLFHLGQQRTQERGSILAMQAASGTLINEGSNADIIMQSIAQESLDTLVVKRNADITASQINNARAQGMWQAEQEMSKIAYDDQMGATVSMINMSAAVEGANFQANLDAIAKVGSSGQQLASNMSNAEVQYNQNNTQINNNLANGMFSAAGQLVTAGYEYAGSRVGSTGNWWEDSTQQPSGSASGGGSSPVGSSQYTFGSGYTSGYTL